MDFKYWFKVLRSTAGSTTRGWQGLVGGKAKNLPKKRLKLYEFEACPYCRLVREVFTELGLDADIYPCPKGGERFRQEAIAIGGKAQFPLLIDPNTGAELYESQAIINYLFTQYGGRAVPWRFRLSPIQHFSSLISSGVIGLDGMYAKPSIMPAQPLVLYGFEASPFSRLVRERLCELEIPYTLINLGKEQLADMGAFGVHAALGEYSPVSGGKREVFMQKTHRVMFPYLEDPNTGDAMFESAEILAYLDRTYAA